MLRLTKYLDKSILKLNKKYPKAKVYIVGGVVRDLLLHRKIKDLDLVISKVSLNNLEKYLKKYGKVNKVGKRFGVIKFLPLTAKSVIDISLPRQERSLRKGGYRDVVVKGDPNLSIEKDLLRRDFTINALAYDVYAKRLIDPVGGRKDLKNKVIRAVGNAQGRFKEDYTRMLRAIRFAAQLNFSIEPKTLSAIKKFAPQINKKRNGKFIVARELIGREFFLSFVHDANKTLQLLEKTNLLKYILPELSQLALIPQAEKFHPEGDVWSHTKIVVKKLQHLKPSASPTLLLSGLFHDLGKAKCVQIMDLKKGTRRSIANPLKYFAKKNKMNSKIRIMNIGHENESAKIAQQIIKRLGLTQFNSDLDHPLKIKEVLYNSREHMLLNIGSIRPSKAEKILFSRNVPRWELIELVRADSTNKKPRRYHRALLCVAEIAKIKKIGRKTKAPAVLISGHDLINIGLKPGPEFKKIILAIREEQLDGRIKTRKQALKWLKSHFL